MSEQAIAFIVWAAVSFALGVAATVIGLYEEPKYQRGGEYWDGTGQNPWLIGTPFVMAWPMALAVAAVAIPMMLIADGVKRLCDRWITGAKP